MVKPTATPPPMSNREEVLVESQYEKWHHWPVNWSAVWVGALASIAAAVSFGLIGLAVGAHLLSPDHRVVELKSLAMGTLAFSIFSAFLAFVIGGYICGKVAGILRSEPGMLHGAITWLASLPLLLVLVAAGASGLLGGWYAGLSGSHPQAMPFEKPDQLGAKATIEDETQYKNQLAEYQRKVKQWQDDTPKVTRNSALIALTALLLGLVGSVIGGWMASGEPMTLSYHRTRPKVRV